MSDMYGSADTQSKTKTDENIAQLAEQRPFKPLVEGSSPSVLTINMFNNPIHKEKETSLVRGKNRG